MRACQGFRAPLECAVMPVHGQTHAPGTEPASRRAAWIQAAVKIAISSFLLWLVLRRFDPAVLRTQVENTSLRALVLPFGIVLLSHLLGAVQWGWLVRTSGLAVAGRRLAALYWTGLFFNHFGIGNIGGDVYKIYALGKREGALGRVAGATIVDRVIGAAALCALALIASGAALWHGTVPGPLSLWVLGVSALTLAAAAVVLHPRVGGELEGVLQRLPLGGAGARLVRLMGYLGEYRKRGGVLHGVFLLSLAIQAARVIAHFCVGLGLGWNLHASDLGKFFLVIPVLGLLIALPISIGGWGVREWAGVALFAPLGQSGEEAVTLLALTALLAFAISTAGGAVVLLGGVPWARRSHAAR